MPKIKNVVVGSTISVYFEDGTKTATMKSHRLMEHLVENGQWTFKVERASVDGAVERIEALKQDLKADVTSTGDTTFKFKVDKQVMHKATAKPEPKSYIRLGRDAVFDNADDAADFVRSCDKVSAPENMIAGLTKTFERGSVEGQVKSVFGDVFAYGMTDKVVAKVRDFAKLVGADARYDIFRAAKKGDVEGHSTTLTFKYNYLIGLAAGLPAESTPETEVAVAA